MYRELPDTCATCATCAKAVLVEQLHDRMCRRCDVVRSIRIGLILDERFDALMRPRLFEGRYANALAVGEAEQVYPEIWASFDRARDVLAADGIAVAEYDHLRAQTRTFAILDVHDRNGTKVFYLDARGLRLATAAGRALQDALPDVDWQTLERADAAEIAATGALTIPKWKQWLVGAAIVIGVIGLCVVFG